MFTVSVACALSAAGLWRGVAWGQRLATGVLVVNIVGDAVNVLLGTEPRAAIGIPIGAALVAYLRSKRVREFLPMLGSLCRLPSAAADLGVVRRGWLFRSGTRSPTNWKENDKESSPPP